MNSLAEVYMSITKLRRFLMTPMVKADPASPWLSLLRSAALGWLCASLLFATICGTLGLKKAFQNEYVVQDDARQHVFWMQRFLEPELFPHDLIADYFQSVAPQGYTALYRLMARIGIHPLLFNKLLPTVLGLVATAYCFGLCMQIFPIPAGGFIATLLLNQNLWMTFDLVSATPRAFAYPLFLAFLYYLSRRSLLPCLAAIAFQGLFYPHIVLISAGVLFLQLWRWEDRKPRFSRDRRDYLLCAAGLGMAMLVILFFVFKSSAYGPTITAAEARALAEFHPGERASFFHRHPWTFWIMGARSGMLPHSFFKPPMLFIGFLLPLLLRFPSRFGVAAQPIRNLRLLPQILLASLGMFFAAHAFLFRLHLPSRYTSCSFRVVMALAAGIAVTLVLDSLLQWADKNPKSLPRALALGSAALLGAALLSYPAWAKKFPRTSYVIGTRPALYEFFSRQPRDILIASLTEEVDNLPTFAGRSILVGRQYAIPYQRGYYRQFRQRTSDLIRAQYSPDLAELQHFIRKYGIDFWLLDRNAFNPKYLAKHRWIRQFRPEAEGARKRLKEGTLPALAHFMVSCSVFETRSLVVLDAGCIKKGKQD